jgi:hypothetical protein
MLHANVHHMFAAIKELHREILALRKDVDELRDEVKVSERGSGTLHIVLGGRQSEVSEGDSDVESVQSAPASMGLH